MEFVVSKIAWFFVDPGNGLLLLLAVGVLCWRAGRRRLGRVLTLLPLALLLLGGFLPTGYWLMQPLETRFPRPALLSEGVDGVVVLGGKVQRLFAMVDLMRRYPEAQIVFTGGSGSLTLDEDREADLIPGLLRLLGADPARVTYDRDSRNTFESARATHTMVRPAPGARWLLVTSAYHMPRSMGVFRAAGWAPIPYPVDYQQDSIVKFPFRASYRLLLLGQAAKEWIGLVVYRALGRTDALLPAPTQAARP